MKKTLIILILICKVVSSNTSRAVEISAFQSKVQYNFFLPDRELKLHLVSSNKGKKKLFVDVKYHHNGAIEILKLSVPDKHLEKINLPPDKIMITLSNNTYIIKLFYFSLKGIKMEVNCYFKANGEYQMTELIDYSSRGARPKIIKMHTNW